MAKGVSVNEIQQEIEKIASKDEILADTLTHALAVLEGAKKRSKPKKQPSGNIYFGIASESLTESADIADYSTAVRAVFDRPILISKCLPKMIAKHPEILGNAIERDFDGSAIQWIKEAMNGIDGELFKMAISKLPKNISNRIMI